LKLQKLLENITVLECAADPETEIRDICYDSRAVQPGDLFVAVSGYAVDGHKYMAKALEAGAAKVIGGDDALAELQSLAREYRRSLKNTTVVALTGSAGKTTTAKRLCTQLRVNGANALHLSTDDYFVGDARNPRHTDGTFDYETIEAVDSARLASDVNALLAGEEVHLRRFDFINHEGFDSEGTTTMPENGYIVLEGIHALNPLLTDGIDDKHKFKIYVSALTTIKLDNHNYIPTTDNRLMRRIVRDYKYRGMSPEDTIARWPSVRRGEDKWIFPFQENADVMFNSALLYELGVIRDRIIPILENIPESKPEYSVAANLSDLIHYFRPIPDEELPPTSILREFLGGSSFKY
jgi:uridine kinase